MRLAIGVGLVVVLAAACSSPGAADGGSGGGQATGGGSGGSGGGSGGGGGASGGSGGGSSFTPHPSLMNLADETAVDLGRFTCSDPGEGADVCRRVTDYSGMIYDGRNHQLLMFGGGHSTTMTDSIFALDLTASTLAWRELHPPTPCSMMVASNLDAMKGAWLAGSSGPYPRPLSIHTYDQLGFAPEQNAFLLLGRLFTGGYCNTVGNDVTGPIAHFDLAAGTWAFTQAASVDNISIPGTERDPVTGRFVIFGNGGLTTYDPATQTRVDHVRTFDGELLKSPDGGSANPGGLGYADHLSYYPPDDTFYYFDRGNPVETWALKLDRQAYAQSTLERVATSGPTSAHEEPGYDYDSKNRVIGGAVRDDTFFAFDPSTRTWTQHAIKGGAPGSQAFHALAYDPVNNVFFFVTDYPSGQRTWAFRLKN